MADVRGAAAVPDAPHPGLAGADAGGSFLMAEAQPASSNAPSAALARRGSDRTALIIIGFPLPSHVRSKVFTAGESFD
jgi:hypothetical protein